MHGRRQGPEIYVEFENKVPLSILLDLMGTGERAVIEEEKENRSEVWQGLRLECIILIRS